MPSNLLPGSQVQRESHIGCQAKPNGNTLPVAERKPSTGGATSSNPEWSIARIVLTSRPRATDQGRQFCAKSVRLYDMGGGVDQWVEDCWHKNYQGAPSDGSAWVEGECVSHVLRSGSWRNDSRYARPRTATIMIRTFDIRHTDYASLCLLEEFRGGCS